MKITDYVVAITNKVTGSRHVTFCGREESEHGYKYFHESIRVFISHRNRLGMKLSDCKYSYAEATDENIDKAMAWQHGTTVEEYREWKREMENRAWI